MPGINPGTYALGSKFEAGCYAENHHLWWWMCQCGTNLTFNNYLTNPDTAMTALGGHVVMQYYEYLAMFCRDGYIDSDLDGYPDYVEMGLDVKKCDWVPGMSVDRTMGTSDPFDYRSWPDYSQVAKTRTKSRTKRIKTRSNFTFSQTMTPTASISTSTSQSSIASMSKKLAITRSESLTLTERPIVMKLVTNTTRICVSGATNSSCFEKVYCQGGSIGDPHILDCNGRFSTCNSAGWQILIETEELIVWTEHYPIVLDSELLLRETPRNRAAIKSVRVITRLGKFVYFNETPFEQEGIDGYLLNQNGIVSNTGDIYVEISRIRTKFGIFLNVQVLVANPLKGLLVLGCGRQQNYSHREECGKINDNFAYYACNGDCELMGNCSLVEMSIAAEQQRNSLGVAAERVKPPITLNPEGLGTLTIVGIGLGAITGLGIGILILIKLIPKKEIVIDVPAIYRTDSAADLPSILPKNGLISPKDRAVTDMSEGPIISEEPMDDVIEFEPDLDDNVIFLNIMMTTF